MVLDRGGPRRLPHIQSHEIAGVVERVGGERVPDAFREGTGVLVYAWQWEHDDMFTAEGLTNLSDSPPLSQASTRTGASRNTTWYPPTTGT